MKPVFTCLLAILLSLSVFAQLDFNRTILLGPDAAKLKTNWGASYYGFIPLQRPIPLGDSGTYMVTFLPTWGAEMHSFKENLIMDRVEGETIFFPDEDENHEYTKPFIGHRSMLCLQRIAMPIRFTIKVSDQLHVSPGIFASYLVGGYYQQRYFEDGIRHRYRKYLSDRADFYGFNRWQYGFSGQITMTGIELYTQFSLAPLFVDGEGPQVSTLSAGLRFYIFYGSKPSRPFGGIPGWD